MAEIIPKPAVTNSPSSTSNAGAGTATVVAVMEEVKSTGFSSGIP